MSRVQMQLTSKATHSLESRGHCEQVLNAAHHQSHSLSGECKTGIVSKFQMQVTMEATHFLESQGQAS